MFSTGVLTRVVAPHPESKRAMPISPMGQCDKTGFVMFMSFV
jgi:hypothetical protein